MAEKEKKINDEIKEQTADGEKLDLDELEQAAGGGNPFAAYGRVPGQKYPVNESGE